jgi:hypothetical protein
MLVKLAPVKAYYEGSHDAFRALKDDDAEADPDAAAGAADADATPSPAPAAAPAAPALSTSLDRPELRGAVRRRVGGS